MVCSMCVSLLRTVTTSHTKPHVQTIKFVDKQKGENHRKSYCPNNDTILELHLIKVIPIVKTCTRYSFTAIFPKTI